MNCDSTADPATVCITECWAAPACYFCAAAINENNPPTSNERTSISKIIWEGLTQNEKASQHLA